MAITPDVLALFAGTLISLLASYVPKFNAWYAALAEDQKKLSMLIVLIVVSTGIAGAACTPGFAFLGLSVTCDQQGIFGLVKVLILTLIANQGVFKITPQANAVKEVKAGVR